MSSDSYRIRQNKIIKTTHFMKFILRNIFNSSKTNKIMKKQNTKAWTAKEENEKKAVNPGAKKVHNLIIVDESGSMKFLYNAALTGMNETLNSIRETAKEYPEQEQEVMLVTFDTEHYNKIFDSCKASDTRELTRDDYHPTGGTPLYDALGKALHDLEPKVKENEAVLVTVITDGYENASCEYSLQDIRTLVERLDEAGWVFTYIGANQNSAKVGKSMGIVDTLDFQADEAGMKSMWITERQARTLFTDESRHPDFNPKQYKRGNFFNG